MSWHILIYHGSTTHQWHVHMFTDGLRSAYAYMKRYWLLVTTTAFLLVSLIGDVTIFKMVYMLFFLLFLLCYEVHHHLKYRIRRKFGIEFILAVWRITKSAKLNTAKFSFYCPMHVKYNNVHQYKICQSLRKDWFAKLNCCQIFILYSILIDCYIRVFFHFRYSLATGTP